MPFPVWVGHWADAWQQRAGMTAPRVPARGGMVAAAVAAWAVMAIGLYLLLLSAIGILGRIQCGIGMASAPGSRSGAWALSITAPGGGQLGGWVVCLVIVAMPLAAAVAHRRWRRSGDAHDAAVPRRRPVATALLCLAGCLAAVALTLAVSAVTHARIAEPVRWSPDFLVRLVFFEEQAIVVVAVACALIAAATARSARTVALSVVVGAAVAAVGALALPTAGAHRPLLRIAQHPVRPSAGRRLPHRPRLRFGPPDRPRRRLGQHPFRARCPCRRDARRPAYPASAPGSRRQGAWMARGRDRGHRRHHGHGAVGARSQRARRRARGQHRPRRLDSRGTAMRSVSSPTGTPLPRPANRG